MQKNKKRAVGNPRETAHIENDHTQSTFKPEDADILTGCPYQNPDLPMEERIDNLLSLMTPAEKLRLFSPKGYYFHRLGFGIPAQVEGYHGAALGGPAVWEGWPVTPTTQFCQAIGFGATWNTELVKECARAQAEELRYVFHKHNKGGLIVRAPNADMGRDIRWGRNEECFGEDPWLNGAMTEAFVKGLQGDHPVYIQTAALLKHFIANSNEDNRSVSSSDFDERLFREYYSYAFYRGFTRGSANCYMTAYNAYNGIPCHIHPVIKEITLKEGWVDGIICTDGKGLSLLVTDHKAFPGLDEATAACIKAGINQFLDFGFHMGLRKAFIRQLIHNEEIDAVLRGNLRTIIRLGLLDPPERVPYTHILETEPWKTEKHRDLARQVMRESIVLLKNSDKVLPLDKNTTKKIAVIGRLADAVHLDWYSGTPPYSITPLEGITKKAPGADITFAKTHEEGIKAAKASDVAIVFIGNHPTCYDIGWAHTPYASEGKEAVDRQKITLEDHELTLVQEVYKANPRTIVVLIAGFPYAITWINDHIPAILHMTHNSQELGNALADVLFGDYNPGGRLVQTWPQSIDHLPEMMDYDIRHGRTYMYSPHQPLYPFGFGLSYTSFSYGEIRFQKHQDPGEIIDICIDVTNTGEITGDEVIQLYVSYPGSAVQRPVKELKGFTRITLKPGEQKSAVIPLKASNCAYWESASGKWTIEPGKIRIMIGSSSADADIKAEGVIEIE
jgi:beta-glucosidase